MTEYGLRDTSSSALSRIELQEMTLLSWGIVDAAFTADEAIAILAQGLPPDTDPVSVFSDLVERVLLVETPDGGIRSRMAETVRLLSMLRQTFPQQEWWQGTPLVLDYRLLHRPRRRPRRDRPRRVVVDRLAGILGSTGRQAIHDLAPELLSGFQERSIGAVLHALGTKKDCGVMVSAGTGSGKTLGFYLPALGWIMDRRSDASGPGVAALALYPRGELLKDQLRAVLILTRRLAASGSDPIRLATWFGPTPASSRWFARGWVESWVPTRGRAGGGWVCPYVTCLDCNREMIWLRRDVDRGLERLTCIDPECGDIIDGKFLALTRQSAVSAPADIMFTTTESLNRQLAAPDQHRAFGLKGRSLRMVLLDEVHTYEGVSGAQNALLARRLRHAVGHPLVWVGLSATLRNAESFLASFTGVYGDRVAVGEVLVTIT